MHPHQTTVTLLENGKEIAAHTGGRGGFYSSTISIIKSLSGRNHIREKEKWRHLTAI